MNIAIVYQYFQGPGEPGHSLVYELAHALSRRGHQVSVVAGETGYMKRTTTTRQPWHRRLFRKECDGGVSILRTYTYPELHRSYFSRLLSFASFSISSAAALLFVKRVDVLLASSPPIFPMFAAGWVCRLRKIPFVVEVRDLWPSSAVQLGIIRSRLQIEIMSQMERWLYDHAHRIVALTEGIRDDIGGRGWQSEKIAFIPCGVDSEQLYPDPEGGARIRRRYGWTGKKVILYFGAMGEANNLSVAINAAQRLRHRSDILFVFIGDGMKRPSLDDRRRAMGLSNVQIMPPVPKQEARRYINAADLCLVTLRDIPLFEGAIPTKLLEYLACGKAVLCGIRGEAARIVRDAQAGVAFAPNDDGRLAELINELTADEVRLQAMAHNGPVFIKKHFAAHDMRLQMERVLEDAAGLRGSSDGLGPN
jgi:glycosyltransferase involved in cell wall biosynthesis